MLCRSFRLITLNMSSTYSHNLSGNNTCFFKFCSRFAMNSSHKTEWEGFPWWLLSSACRSFFEIGRSSRPCTTLPSLCMCCSFLSMLHPSLAAINSPREDLGSPLLERWEKRRYDERHHHLVIMFPDSNSFWENFWVFLTDLVGKGFGILWNSLTVYGWRIRLPIWFFPYIFLVCRFSEVLWFV